MLKRRILTVLGLATILACQPPEMTTAERLQAQQQLEGKFSGWVQAMNNGQRDEVLAFYHNHSELLVFWPDGGVVRGYEQQERRLHDFFNAIRYMNFVAQQPRTELLGAETALTTFGHSTDIIHQDSRRVVEPGYGTIVWIRDPVDQEWKIHFQHLSANSMN